MSTMIATFDLPTENPRLALSDPARDVRGKLRPWGFWGTLGWGLFAVAAALFAVVVYTGFWMLTHQLRIPDFSDAAFGIVAGIVASVAPVIVLVIAVRADSIRRAAISPSAGSRAGTWFSESVV